MSATILSLILLGGCLVVALTMTASQNHGAAWFPYFGGMAAAIAVFMNTQKTADIMSQIVLFVIAVFCFLMALDSMGIVNQK